MRKRILLIDDHPLMREGLKAVLRRLWPEATIAEAGHAQEALAQAAAAAPDLVICDINLPGMNGVDLLRRLRPAYPHAQVLVVAAEADPWTVEEILQLGAKGFVCKANTAAHLALAVEAVCQGDLYLCPTAEAAFRQSASQGVGAMSVPGPSALSPREREILICIAQGQTTKAIAASLGISPKTVETHRLNLMRRLHLDNGQELTRYAIRHGLIIP